MDGGTVRSVDGFSCPATRLKTPAKKSITRAIFIYAPDEVSLLYDYAIGKQTLQRNGLTDISSKAASGLLPRLCPPRSPARSRQSSNCRGSWNRDRGLCCGKTHWTHLRLQCV